MVSGCEIGDRGLLRDCKTSHDLQEPSFEALFPSLLRRDRQRVGHWRVENCANSGEQVAGCTRAGVPANRGVIIYTSATQRTEIREPHCATSEH